MDKRTIQAIINCYLDPELEDKKSIRENLIDAGIDSEKFRNDMIRLVRTRQMQMRKGFKNRRKELKI